MYKQSFESGVKFESVPTTYHFAATCSVPGPLPGVEPCDAEGMRAATNATVILDAPVFLRQAVGEVLLSAQDLVGCSTSHTQKGDQTSSLMLSH